MLFIAFGSFALYKWLVLGRSDKHSTFSHVNKLISGGIIVCYFLYLFVTATLMEALNCIKVDDSDPNTYMLVGDLEPCYEPGGLHMRVFPIAIVFMLLYTFGFPAILAYTLWNNREAIMEDQLLRAKGLGYDRISNPRAYDLRRSIERAYFAFRPEYAAGSIGVNSWVVVILARKALIAITSLVWANNSSLQLSVSLLVLLCSYAMQVYHTPYMAPADREQTLRDTMILALEDEHCIWAKLQKNVKEVEKRL